MHPNGPLGEISDAMREAGKASPHFDEGETLIITIASDGENMSMSVSGLPPMKTFKLLMAAIETVITSMGGNLSIATMLGHDDD